MVEAAVQGLSRGVGRINVPRPAQRLLTERRQGCDLMSPLATGSDRFCSTCLFVSATKAIFSEGKQIKSQGSVCFLTAQRLLWKARVGNAATALGRPEPLPRATGLQTPSYRSTFSALRALSLPCLENQLLPCFIPTGRNLQFPTDMLDQARL